MDINLRGIDPNFETSVNQIKQKFDISTNTKAVEFCTVNYLSKLAEIEDLKLQLKNARDVLNIFDRKKYELKQLLQWYTD